MAHTAQYHTFIRCEGNTLLRKLPEEARLSLRYFETVGLLNHFRPLPPLASSRNVIKGKKYYYVAITDWSLFLLTKDNKVEGSVLLEVPWLGVRELDKTEADSDEFVKRDPKKPDSVIRSLAVSLYPEADLASLPPVLLRKLRLAANGAGNRPDSGADRSGGKSKSAGGGGAQGGSGCCGRGAKAAGTVAEPNAGAAPREAQQQQHAPALAPQQWAAPMPAMQPAHAPEPQVLMPQQQAAGPGLRQQAAGPGLQQQAAGPGLQQQAAGPGLRQQAARPGLQQQAPGPGLQQQAAGPGLRQQAAGPGLRQQAAGPGLQQQAQQSPYAAWELLRSQQPDPRAPLPLWEAQRQQQQPEQSPRTTPRSPEQVVHHTGDQYHAHPSYDGGYYDRGNDSPAAVPPYGTYSFVPMGPGMLGPAPMPGPEPYEYEPGPTWDSGPGTHQAAVTGPASVFGAGFAMRPAPAMRSGPARGPGPLGEGTEWHSPEAAAASPTAASLLAGSFTPGGAPRPNLFSTLRRRGEDGATTQVVPGRAFGRVSSLTRTRRTSGTGGEQLTSPRAQHGGGGGDGTGFTAPAAPRPRADEDLHRAVEASMRQMEEAGRRQAPPLALVMPGTAGASAPYQLGSSLRWHMPVSPAPQVHPGTTARHPLMQTFAHPAEGAGARQASSASAAVPAPVAVWEDPNVRLSASLRPQMYRNLAAPAPAPAPSRLGPAPGTGTDVFAAPAAHAGAGAAMGPGMHCSPGSTMRSASSATSTVLPYQYQGAGAAAGPGVHLGSLPESAATTAPLSPGAASLASASSPASHGKSPAATSSKATTPTSKTFKASLAEDEQPFPAFTRRGRRSRNLPPEPGDFQLPAYPSCQPALLASANAATATTIGSAAAALSPIVAPLARLGAKVLARQQRLQPRYMWEEREAREQARQAGGGVPTTDVPDDDEEAYEDFWIPDSDDDELTPEEELLADYRLVLVTVERKSNLFFHIQRAWLGAHMRLALTEAGVIGMPLWYAPPFLPVEVVHSMALPHPYTYGRSGAGLGLAGSNGMDPAQQALRFFSEQATLSRGLESALESASGALALELFPSASADHDGREGSLQHAISAAAPMPRTPSSLQLGAGGGGNTAEPQPLRVSVSTAFLSLYDALQARRQGRISAATATLLGASPYELPPSPRDTVTVNVAAAARRWQTAAAAAVGSADGAGSPRQLSRTTTADGLLLRGGSAADVLAAGGSRRTLFQAGASGGAGGATRRSVKWRRASIAEGLEDEGASSALAEARSFGAFGDWSPFMAATALAGDAQASAVNVPELNRRGSVTWAPSADRAAESSTHSRTSALSPPPGNRAAATTASPPSPPPASAYASVAAERYAQNSDGLAARSFYNELEEAMRAGCGLFDEQDADTITEIILERTFSQTPRAMQLSKCFFNSPTVFSFILSRLQAWGAVCALYSSVPPARPAPSPPKKAQPPSLRHAGTSPARGSVSSRIDPGPGPPSPVDLAPSASQQSHMQQSGGRGQQAGQGGARYIQSPKHSTYTATATAVRALGDLHPGGKAAAGQSAGALGYGPKALASSPAGPVAEAIEHPGPYADAASSSSPLHVARDGRGARGDGGGHASDEGEGDAAPPRRRGHIPTVVSFSNFLTQVEADPEPPSEPPTATTPDFPALADPEPLVVPPLFSSSSPRPPPLRLPDALPSEAAPSPRHASTSLSHATSSPRASARSQRSSTLHEDIEAEGEPFRPRPDKSTLQQAAELEEETAFFERLHAGRSWAAFSWGPRRQRHLLRRLGLHPGEPTSIRSTVAALADIVALQQQREVDGPVGRRSPAPPMQAPPTLHADPLSLSPLHEAPFLFVLQHPELHPEHQPQLPPQQQQQQRRSHFGGGSGAWLRSDGRATGANSGRVSFLDSVRPGSISQIGGGRRSTAASGLRSAYMQAYLGQHTDPAEELLGGPAVELWDRLVGRLAARVAFRRIKLLLSWLQQELAFSEGCEERLNWLSEAFVESDPDAPPEMDWSFARCTRTLAALMLQLADPCAAGTLAGAASAAAAGAGLRYPPEGPELRPCDAQDMMYWIRYEAGAYPLDWCVGVLFELAGLSEEAQAVGRYPVEDVVLQVVRQLPREVLLQFVRRAFLRLACFMMGTASLHGVSRQGTLAAVVSAFRYGSVLLSLVQNIRTAADMLADQFFLQLYFLFRTPQVQERLQEVRSGQDALLGAAVGHLFERLLQLVGEAALDGRGGGAAGELGIGHVVSRAAFSKMPGRVT